MTGPEDLEARVAALEKMATPSLTEPDWTREQIEEFQKALDDLPGSTEVRVLPPARLVTVEDVRQLLRECVTVVRPGETLIIRGQRDWTPNQLHEVQEHLNSVVDWWKLCFRVLVVPGDELGVAEAPGA